MTTLTQGQVNRGRNLVVKAATLTYRRRDEVHYTQGPQRWEGISKRLDPRKGEFPRYADCSSHNSWCLFVPLALVFKLSDLVNGAAWLAGYTGTMLRHGREVTADTARRGDLVVYGPRGSTGAHVAIVVKRGPFPLVISHGSESGPHLLPYNYRADIMSIRRYIPEATAKAPTKPKPRSAPAAKKSKAPPMNVKVIDTLRNSRHPDVEIWQQRMKNLGYQIAVDRVYGEQSEGVCRKVQVKHKLIKDGQLGPKTWDASWA